MSKHEYNVAHDPAHFSHYRRALIEQHDAPVGKVEAAMWIAVCAMLSTLAVVALSS